MRLMITLLGDAPSASIDDHLRGALTVVSSEQLDPVDAVTISAHGDATPVVERSGSELRAVWIVEAPSRADAVAIAREAPGTDGMLDVRESYMPEDFGAPPGTPAPPPPPVPRTPGTQRYIAFIRSDRVAESGEGPRPASMEAMGVYCDELVKTEIMLGGQGLKASARGSRIRRSAAQRFVLDGPFTESKELVAGYMIVQAPTIDDAVDIIRPWLKIHREGQGVPFSAIEVRRLV